MNGPSRVAILCSVVQAEERKHPIFKSDAKMVVFPTIRFNSVPIKKKIYIERLQKGYDYIIFTSKTAVQFFFKQVEIHQFQMFTSAAKYVAVGVKTAEYMKNIHLDVALIPKEFSTSGILHELENQNLEGKRFLLPCSSIANPQLADGLKAKGAVVDSLVVYETIPQSKTESAPKIKKMQKNIFDYFLFTSPSAYESFLYLVGIQSPREYFGEAKIIAIGKTTRAAIKGSGIENVSIPSAATFENMLTMIPFTI